MWGETFAGRSPYGSSEDFQTLDGELNILWYCQNLPSPKKK